MKFDRYVHGKICPHGVGLARYTVNDPQILWIKQQDDGDDKRMSFWPLEAETFFLSSGITNSTPGFCLFTLSWI